jgi:hypothetical protein
MTNIRRADAERLQPPFKRPDAAGHGKGGPVLAAKREMDKPDADSIRARGAHPTKTRSRRHLHLQIPGKRGPGQRRKATGLSKPAARHAAPMSNTRQSRSFLDQSNSRTGIFQPDDSIRLPLLLFGLGVKLNQIEAFRAILVHIIVAKALEFAASKFDCRLSV